MPTDTSGAVDVFISYVHEDEEFVRKLQKHLSTLKRQGVVASWYDRDISAGADWATEIDTHLSTATIILLLVSANFLASDYCWRVEMERAMERHERKEACVVPLILRSCDWNGTPFERLKVLPTDGMPISKWDDEDDAFLEVVKGIRTVLKDLQADPAFVRAAEVPVRVVVENVPYARNRLFTGREAVLTQLYEELHQEKAVALTQAISGLGGIGKTQTALEYTYRYRDEYSHIFWITADSLLSVRSGMATIGALLKLPLGQEQEQAVIIEAVKRWMQQHDGWLLILDNVESLKDIEGLPPLNARGHTLITTRSQSMGKKARPVGLETMSVEEGALLLLRRANVLDMDAEPLTAASEADQASASELTQELGGLPLALDQAGAYIEETQCGLRGYLELYRQRYAELLAERGGIEEDYPETVATTWSLSFEKVQQDSPAAKELLDVCALLDPDAIPEDILVKGASELGSTLEKVGSDPLALNKVIKALLNYSLIRRNPNHTLTIHRLVQVVLRAAMSHEDAQLWSERVVKALAASLPPVDYDKDHWSQCQLYLPQVQRGVELIEQQQFTFGEVAQHFQWLGNVKYKQARYQEGAPLLQQALVVGEQALGPEDLLVAAILNDLAELYREQAKYQEADPLYQRALEIREKVLGESHSDTATSLNNAARGYYSRGKYIEAELYYQRALEIREKVLGNDHPDTAMSMNDLALLYRDQGRYGEAEPLLRQTLQIREEVLGAQHLDTALSLNNLAFWYRDQERYGEAELLYRRALQIREEVLGGRHPDTALILGNLATCYQDQGRYGEAEPLLKQVLQIHEEVLGAQHPTTATSLNNLATWYQDQERYGEAELLWRRALQIREEALGAQHPDTALSLNNLALWHQNQGQWQMALVLHKQALAIREKVLGDLHPDTALSLNNLGIIYFEKRFYREAAPLLRRSLAICEQVLGAQHPDTQRIRENYELVQAKMRPAHGARKKRKK